MITDLELERVAAAIERTLLRSAGSTDWTQVERLRLHSDLLDRLAAAQRHWTGSLSRQAEIVRDSAERLADELSNVAGALTSTNRGGDSAQSATEPPRPRRVTRAGTLPVPEEAVSGGPAR